MPARFIRVPAARCGQRGIALGRFVGGTDTREGECDKKGKNCPKLNVFLTPGFVWKPYIFILCTYICICLHIRRTCTRIF